MSKFSITPVAVTGAAKVGRCGAALLHGTVNAEGEQTGYHFEYGVPSGASAHTTVGFFDNDEFHSVSASLTGLARGTTYRYQLVASDTAGRVSGKVGAFTTLPSARPQVSTGGASHVAANSVTVAGTVNPECSATSYYFQFGTTTGYGNSTPHRNAGSGTAAQAVSANISGLRANTLYHYRIAGISGAGTGTGVDRTFRTS